MEENALTRTLLSLYGMAASNHGECDLEDDVECSAEQYGDGNAGEHRVLHDAEALILKEVTEG